MRANGCSHSSLTLAPTPETSINREIQTKSESVRANVESNWFSPIVLLSFLHRHELNDKRIIFRQKNKRTYSEYNTAYVFLFVLLFLCLKKNTLFYSFRNNNELK